MSKPDPMAALRVALGTPTSPDPDPAPLPEPEPMPEPRDPRLRNLGRLAKWVWTHKGRLVLAILAVVLLGRYGVAAVGIYLAYQVMKAPRERPKLRWGLLLLAVVALLSSIYFGNQLGSGLLLHRPAHAKPAGVSPQYTCAGGEVTSCQNILTQSQNLSNEELTHLQDLCNSIKILPGNDALKADCERFLKGQTSDKGHHITGDEEKVDRNNKDLENLKSLIRK